MKVLVVDDEKAIAIALRDNLQYEKYEVDMAHNGTDALDQLRAKHYHLVILDVMMPGMSGFEVLEKFRTFNPYCPVIMLTAKSMDSDKINGFRLGADDYVTKPFNLMELMARVKAILKRTSKGSEITTFSLNGVEVDFETMTFKDKEGTQEMGRYEVDLLRLLISKPDKVFSRQEIMTSVWGMECFPSNRTIDNYIVKLRQKFENDPKKPEHIHTVYGVGYKYTP